MIKEYSIEELEAPNNTVKEGYREYSPDELAFSNESENFTNTGAIR